MPRSESTTQPETRSKRSAKSQPTDPGPNDPGHNGISEKSRAEAKKARKGKGSASEGISPAATKPDDLHHMIAVRAYEIWESQGRPHGADVMHWQQAERDIADTSASATHATSVEPTKRKKGTRK